MEDFDRLIGQNKPTLVDFFATWCGPCKMQGPIMDDVKAEFGDAVNVIKVDVDSDSSLASRYNIRSVPTLIIFLGGEAMWRGNGLHDQKLLADKLREYINYEKYM